ncbi:MAG: hypothetical protein NTY25_09810 [Planctomycetia bacterium]|nr:hypothetical protein [Planctomycetia bacterium]
MAPTFRIPTENEWYKAAYYSPNYGGSGVGGTFDQSGNVYQWNDLDGTAGSFRGLRGGGWIYFSNFVSSSDRYSYDPSFGYNAVGFRLASPV